MENEPSYYKKQVETIEAQGSGRKVNIEAEWKMKYRES